MKYTVAITINKPIEEVLEKFHNPANRSAWMPGFIDAKVLEGEEGQVGAKVALTFQMGKRQMMMIETILERKSDKSIRGCYEANNVYNEVNNLFESIDTNTTRYTSEQYFRFGGGMKVIGWIFPKAFKKQSMVYLEKFKAFVETLAPLSHHD